MWRWCTVLVHLCLLHDFSDALQSFVREPSDQYVREGQTVVLPCQVSEPVGQVQWTRDEFGLGVIRDLPSYPRYQMIGDDHEGIYSLEVQRATLEDDAVFQCQVGSAAGQQGIRSRDARLTILVPPEPPRVIQGDRVTTAAGPGGPASIGADADGKRSVVRSTLVLTAAPAHHDTTVTCRAHNAALTRPQTAAVRLQVTFPPEVSVSADRARAAEFDDVTLHCRATANPGQVRYRWFVNGEPLPGQTDSSTTLRAVGRHLDNASVLCQVTNAAGTGSDATQINVLYAPRFRTEPRDVAAAVGQEATLLCDVDANPAPEVSWVRRECDACPEPVGTGRRLTLVASADTVGLYECRTSGEHHPAVSRQIRLFVRAPPRVTAPPTQRGTAGQLVHLECSVASVPPPTAVTWLFNNQPVPLDAGHCAVVEEVVVGGIRSLLVIPDAREEDFGLYNCSVTNTYGTDSALVILEKQRELPLLVILTIVIGGIIVITTIILVIIMCQRHRRRAKDVPTEPVVFDKTVKPTADANSSGSDLKVEIRTSSSGSGQVITDRWDGAHYPGHRALYEQHSDERAFPPFDKEAMPQNGTGMYPPYDQNGYLHKPGGQQRMLHASTPIEFGARPPADSPSHSQHYYGPTRALGRGRAHVDRYADPPRPSYAQDVQMKPGTMATPV
ncbi:irregular chiasm C-roughest protein-like [Pollicipes pollicipes]|uniref:irregular chiasm C-roughest protein-like n=1 Tax=Pollicipes pollicipes TaxID=41117 RepID=UPI001884EB24|nr:irregular chiasm C-roughest protein-like [Pollicipes pollicipes]